MGLLLNGLLAELPATPPNEPICAVDTQKVAKLMDSITRQSCGELQPGGFSLAATRTN